MLGVCHGVLLHRRNFPSPGTAHNLLQGQSEPLSGTCLSGQCHLVLSLWGCSSPGLCCAQAALSWLGATTAGEVAALGLGSRSQLGLSVLLEPSLCTEMTSWIKSITPSVVAPLPSVTFVGLHFSCHAVPSDSWYPLACHSPMRGPGLGP